MARARTVRTRLNCLFHLFLLLGTNENGIFESSSRVEFGLSFQRLFFKASWTLCKMLHGLFVKCFIKCYVLNVSRKLSTLQISIWFYYFEIFFIEVSDFSYNLGRQFSFPLKPLNIRRRSLACLVIILLINVCQ